MTEIINTITPFLQQHRYIFAFLGALFEGTNIMLLGGFLYKLGLFKFWNILFILSLGYFINGYGWYAVGRFWGKKILEKWGPRFFLSEKRIKKLEEYFEKHTTKALIISRITYGLSMYTFMMAGIFRIKGRKFFWCSLISTLIWVLALFGIGYIFGASYELLSKVIRVIAGWLVVVLFIVIILLAVWLIYWFRRSARMKFIERVLNHEGWEKLKWLGKKIYEFLNKNIG